MLLHGGGTGVAAQSYVAHYDFPHVNIMELKRKWYTATFNFGAGDWQVFFKNHHRDTYILNRARAIVASGLHRNVIILLKVNPCVTSREQLTENKQWGKTEIEG